MRILFARMRLWPGAGWIWPLALLALPGCAGLLNIQDVSYSSPATVPRGDLPESSAVFCQIEQVERRCLDPTNPEDASRKAMGVRLEDAAIALVTSQRNAVGLDYSAANGCDPQQPKAAFFYTSFPDGYPVCLNCLAVTPGTGQTPDALCKATCVDLFKASAQPGDAAAFCATHARVAANVAPDNACYDSACFNGSTPRNDFIGPRIHPEPVVWNLSPGLGLDSNGDIFRKSPTPPDPQVFDEGADSSQMITHGNAYVQFTVNETQLRTRLIGLSEGPPDSNTDYRQLKYAFDMFKDGYLYLFENGEKPCPPPPVTIPPPPIPPPSPCAFQQIPPNAVYRIVVTDNLDGTGAFAPMGGTATVTYVQIDGVCVDGKPCNGHEIYPSDKPAHYPLRVDSSFHDQGATLTNVRLVRIKDQ
jgi:hypothetical protein